MEYPTEFYNLSDVNNTNVSFTIMYLDDNPIDTWLAVKVMESSTIAREVITASNGEDGCKVIADYYQKNSKLPDVIIIDLQMPGMDGFELIQKIRELPYYSEEQTRLVLTTVGLDDKDIININEKKIRHVLLKPFGQEQLYELLNVG